MGIGSLIDRAVAVFSPMAGGRRMVARSALEAMGGGYRGGSRGARSLLDWKVTSGSANADLLLDLPTLRDRSRDLERNSPIAGGAIATNVTNVVGTGLQLQSRVDAKALGLTPEQAADWQNAAEREWAHFCRTCDLTRTQTFPEMTALVLRSTLVSGDIFTVRRFLERPGEVYGLKLQLVEADRVANPRGLRDGARIAGDGNAASGGVEIDGDGAPVAYHVCKVHPGGLDFAKAGAGETDRFEAFDGQGRRRILHHFTRLRPEQDRGVPYLAPVVEALKQLTRYSQSELDAAVLQSFFAIFVEAPGGGDLAASPGGAAATTSPGETPIRQVGPASIVGLRPSEKVVMADPTRPNGNFDGFVLAFCRQVGVALELPYELLVKHFTASYSAARAALLEAWKTFRARRAWLVRSFCAPVYEWLITEAVLRGRLAAPGFLEDPLAREAWLGADWIGPPPGQIDELKEADAAGKRIELRLSTRAREAANLTGADWEDTERQLESEEATIAAAGVDPAAAFRPALPAPPPDPNPDLPEQA